MYQTLDLAPASKYRHKRIIDSMIMDRGKKHYFEPIRGDYGIYQSEQKNRAKQYHRNCERRHQHLYNLRQRVKTQEVYKSQPSRKQQSPFLQTKFNQKYRIENDVQNQQQKYQNYDNCTKAVENFSDIKHVGLPKIKKNDKQAQTTDQLMYFHPILKNHKKEQSQQLKKYEERPSANQTIHARILPNNQRIPTSFHDKYKLSQKPRTSIIGHEEDDRYNKYDNSHNEKKKIRSYRSYVRYTPTYASSEQSSLSHYFGDGPIDYQQNQKNSKQHGMRYQKKKKQY